MSQGQNSGIKASAFSVILFLPLPHSGLGSWNGICLSPI